jgi:SnoaL-like domain
MAKPVKKALPKAAKANKSGTKQPVAAKKAPVVKKMAPAAKVKAAQHSAPKKPTPAAKPAPKPAAKPAPKPAVVAPKAGIAPKPVAPAKPSLAPAKPVPAPKAAPVAKGAPVVKAAPAKPIPAPPPPPAPSPKPVFAAPPRPPEPQRPTPIRLKAPSGPTAARVTTVRNLLEAQRKHDLAGLLACFGPEPTLEFAGGPRHVGVERVGQIYGDLLRAFPDLTVDVIGEHASERSVVVELVMQGSHRQQWLGMAPRGRTLTLPVCSVFLFDKKDQLTAQRMYLDRNLAIVQLTSGLLR